MLQKRQKVLARAPSTRDPTETFAAPERLMLSMPAFLLYQRTRFGR
jgi:hypothetical protein